MRFILIRRFGKTFHRGCFDEATSGLVCRRVAVFATVESSSLEPGRRVPAGSLKLNSQPLMWGADGRLLFEHDGACPSTRQVDLIGSLACAAV